MTIKEKNDIFDLVKIICGTTVSYPEKKRLKNKVNDVPTNTTWEAAEELLSRVGVSEWAEVYEIPLCWDNQVAIRFTLGDNNQDNPIIFDLSAGVHKSDPEIFFIELYVENDDEEVFPCDPDNDIGNYLMQDVWRIEDGKIVE